MRAIRRRDLICVLGLLSAATGCGDLTPGAGSASRPDEPAQRLLGLLQGELGPVQDGEPLVLSAVPADQLVLDGEWLRPVFGARTRVAARVRVSSETPGRFQLRDEESDVSVEVVMAGAERVLAEPLGASATYRRGHRTGADVVIQVTGRGLEDVLHFERAPEAREVSYDMILGDAVAGLRLVANTLELLDEGGAPRLRIAPPYLLDAREVRHDAVLSVRGCAVDESPTPPWRREVTAPGARRCEVVVSWDDSRVTYPALLDPVWTTADSMITARAQHTATRLPSGLVLVAGGVTIDGGLVSLASAELYDPDTGTWAATGALETARRLHTASLLQDGRVVVTGGGIAGPFDMTDLTDIWEAGTWSPAAPLNLARINHTATTLSDGRVLVAGGTGPSLGATASAEVLDPATSSWTVAGSMGTGRLGHTAVRLDDGRVLVAGGAGGTTVYGTSEIYTPDTDTWAPSAGPMGSPRFSHAMVLLDDGRALAVGGLGSDLLTRVTAVEVFDSTDETWSGAGALSVGRDFLTAVTLPSGRVVVAGGTSRESASSPPVPSSSADCFDPGANEWGPTADLGQGRYFHTAVLLDNGSVLVAGGVGTSTPPILDGAELFDRCPGPVPCELAEDCENGFCVDGFCCDEACGGDNPDDCLACSVAAGATEDGLCSTVPSGAECDDSDVCTAADVCDAAGVCAGDPIGCVEAGWMTGGGWILDSPWVGHLFHLHCDAGRGHNLLQVIWHRGRFHLEELGTTVCFEDPAISAGRPITDFNTLTGTGTGRYNGESGATVAFTFTDAGEPGRNDTAELTIWDVAGDVVLSVSGTIRGNHQAHH